MHHHFFLSVENDLTNWFQAMYNEMPPGVFIKAVWAHQYTCFHLDSIIHQRATSYIIRVESDSSQSMSTFENMNSSGPLFDGPDFQTGSVRRCDWI